MQPQQTDLVEITITRDHVSIKAPSDQAQMLILDATPIVRALVWADRLDSFQSWLAQSAPGLLIGGILLATLILIASGCDQHDQQHQSIRSTELQDL